MKTDPIIHLESPHNKKKGANRSEIGKKITKQKTKDGTFKSLFFLEGSKTPTTTPVSYKEQEDKGASK